MHVGNAAAEGISCAPWSMEKSLLLYEMVGAPTDLISIGKIHNCMYVFDWILTLDVSNWTSCAGNW